MIFNGSSIDIHPRAIIRDSESIRNNPLVTGDKLLSPIPEFLKLCSEYHQWYTSHFSVVYGLRKKKSKAKK
jgi:hypothetical protein